MPDNTKTSLGAEIDAAVESILPDVVGLRRRLHANPEPSGEELQTSLLLYQMLGDLGAEVRMGPAGCGVIADARVESDRRIALRADIDALRIQDEKQVEYRSRADGVMHACGHDAHSSIVFGVIRVLASMAAAGKLPWPVPWRAVFQPAEETATGAREMVASGAVEGVVVMLGLHVEPTLPVGKIGLREGVLTAHCESLRVTVEGRGGHAARPHESRDPLVAAAQLINSVYQFIPRTTDSHEAVVVTFGRIHGGENANVIPDRVEIDGTVRTLEATVREQTMDQIRRVARGVSEVSNTNIDVDFRVSIPSVCNDATLTRVVSDAASEVVGPENLFSIPRPSMGSEDFACYLEHVPGMMFRLGTAAAGREPTPLHTPRFDIDESALGFGVRILARAAIALAKPAGDS